MGGQGALGLPQELLILSQAEKPATPCHENTVRQPFPQICPADPTQSKTRREEIHLFLSRLGNVGMDKMLCTQIKVKAVWGKVTKAADIIKSGEE